MIFSDAKVCVFLVPCCSEEEAHNLPAGVLAPGFLVVHDPVGGGEDQVPELTGGQDISGELLDVTQGHVETR